MPKVSIKTISETEEFEDLILKIIEAKNSIEGWKKHLDVLEQRLIQSYSDIDDSTSDFEGIENLESDAFKVKFNHKLTRNVDKEKADEVLRLHGWKPEDLFSVKYGYSATLYRSLNDEGRNAVLDSMTTKRAKTSVEITAKEN